MKNIIFRKKTRQPFFHLIYFSLLFFYAPLCFGLTIDDQLKLEKSSKEGRKKDRFGGGLKEGDSFEKNTVLLVSQMFMSPANKAQFDPSRPLMLTVRRDFNSKATISFSFSQYTQHVKNNDVLFSGQSKVMPLIFSMERKYILNEKVSVSYGFGLDYFLFRHELDKAVKEEFAGMGIGYDEKIENTFGYQGNVGVAVLPFKSPKWGLDFQLGLLFLKPKVTYDVTYLGNQQSTGAKSNLNSKWFSLGLFYVF